MAPSIDEKFASFTAERPPVASSFDEKFAAFSSKPSSSAIDEKFESFEAPTAAEPTSVDEKFSSFTAPEPPDALTDSRLATVPRISKPKKEGGFLDSARQFLGGDKVSDQSLSDLVRGGSPEAQPESAPPPPTLAEHVAGGESLSEDARQLAKSRAEGVREKVRAGTATPEEIAGAHKGITNARDLGVLAGELGEDVAGAGGWRALAASTAGVASASSFGLTDLMIKRIVDDSGAPRAQAEGRREQILGGITEFAAGILTGKTAAAGVGGTTGRISKNIDFRGGVQGLVRALGGKGGLGTVLATRAGVGGGMSASRNMTMVMTGEQDFETGARQVAIDTTLSLLGIVPEQSIKPGLKNFVGQVATQLVGDLLADTTITKRFQEQGAKEWFINEIPNLVAAVLFAGVDLFDKGFPARQAAINASVMRTVRDLKNGAKSRFTRAGRSGYVDPRQTGFMDEAGNRVDITLTDDAGNATSIIRNPSEAQALGDEQEAGRVPDSELSPLEPIRDTPDAAQGLTDTMTATDEGSGIPRQDGLDPARIGAPADGEPTQGLPPKAVTAEGEATVPPARPPQEPADIPDIPDGEKIRGFTRQLLNDPSLDEDIKRGLKDRTYVPVSNIRSAEVADALISEKGQTVAEDMVLDHANNMNDTTRGLMSQRLVRMRNAQGQAARLAGDDGGADVAFDKAITLSDAISLKGTQGGQFIQQFSQWGQMTSEGLQRLGSKQKQSKADKAAKKQGPQPKAKDLDKVPKEAVDKLNDATKEAGTRAAKTGKTTRAKKKIKDKAIKAIESDDDAPVWVSYRKAISERIQKQVVQALSGGSGSGKNIPAALQQFSDRISKLAESQLNLPKARVATMSNVEKLKLVIQDYTNNPEKYKQAIRQAKAETKEAFKGQPAKLAEIDKVFEGVFGKPFTEGHIAKVTRDAMNELDININKLVVSHYSDKSAAKTELTQKLRKEVGLDQEDAQQFTDSVRAEVNRLSRQEKKRIVGAYVKPSEKRASKSFIEKVVEQSNAGAFDDADFRTKFAENLGAESRLTSSEAEKINRLANEIQEAPEGDIQNAKIIEMLTYMDTLSGGPTRTDIGTSLWYANILSGVRTQERNILDTVMNVTADTFASAAANKVNPMTALGVMLKGAATKGAATGARTIVTGQGRNAGNKFTISSNQLRGKSPLERNPFTGNASILNKWKFVARVMGGEDDVWFKGRQDAEAWILANRMAKESAPDGTRLKGKALAVEVEKILGTPENIEVYTRQADAEGLTGLNKKLRVYELTEQNRPPEIMERATEAGLRSTYNFQPEGLIGKLSNLAAQIAAEHIYLKPIVPFTRIVANVTNRAINYTPLGFKRQFVEGMGRTALTEQQRTELAISNAKAFVGTTLMMSAYAADTIGIIGISGSGPPDTEKRNQLRETGWRPWSINIGDNWFDYRLSPMSIGFALVGNVRDAEKYNKLDELQWQDALTAGLLMGGNVVLEQSFLSGVGDMFEMMAESKRNPKRAIQIARNSMSRTVGGAIPNIFRDIEKLFTKDITENRNTKEAIMRQIPFASVGMDKKINALGETATFKGGIIISKIGSDPVWNMLAEKDVKIPVPNKTQAKIGNRTMLADEYRAYIQTSGRMLRTRIEDNMSELSRMTTEELQEWLSDNTDANNKNSVRYAAKAQLFGVTLPSTRKKTRKRYSPTRN
jgi:predicted house-cleaning noncanonical NTP pyrophosphatase (MazG superfamily)